MVEGADPRVRAYLRTMMLRSACLVALVLAPRGWWSIPLLALAALLPVLAVVRANRQCQVVAIPAQRRGGGARIGSPVP